MLINTIFFFSNLKVEYVQMEIMSWSGIAIRRWNNGN